MLPRLLQMLVTIVRQREAESRRKWCSAGIMLRRADRSSPAVAAESDNLRFR